MTVIHQEIKRRIARVYLDLNELFANLEAVNDEIYSRVYDEAIGPEEGSPEYKDVMTTMDTICKAMENMSEASNCLSDII